jgi:HAD superfamily hydrolase (TIGR01509 family)
MSTAPARCRSLQIRAVIFDMDGVVIDSHPAHREAWHSFLRTLHRDVCDKELDYILDGRKREDILRHFLGSVSLRQLRQYGKQKDTFFQKQTHQIQPMPGVVEFLEHLRRQRVPLGIATSASEKRTYSTLERLKLCQYFTAIITANDVVASKPDPAIYQLACQSLSVPPMEALAIEDAFSGVQAAKAAGLRCVGIPGDQDGRRLLEAGADVILQSLCGVTLKALEHQLRTVRKRYA